jgi:hypothetical protein
MANKILYRENCKENHQKKHFANLKQLKDEGCRQYLKINLLTGGFKL